MKSLCEGCGVCCLSRGRPPFDFQRDDRAAVPAGLLAEIEAYVTGPRYSRDHPCLWLDLPTGKCKHYDLRPLACRGYIAGENHCNAERESRRMVKLTVSQSLIDAGFTSEEDARQQIQAMKDGACCGPPSDPTPDNR